MAKVQGIADPEYVNSQYRTSTNLNARIRLHQQFSTNKYGWQRWLFDQIRFAPQNRILELGCGTGALWLENLDRIPAGMEIVVSDLSSGLVAQTQQSPINSYPGFQFKVIDAQSIPYEDDRFDIVIASHMLYHVPDRTKALSEIRRVLKPTGSLYTSTVGKKHLIELTELICRFNPQLSSWGKLPSDSFCLENGHTQLRKYFATVTLHRYRDALIVTDTGSLTDYILSGRIVLTPEQKEDLAEFVKREMNASNGKFYITKDSGVFEASGSLKT